MPDMADLTAAVKQVALNAGADLVGVADIDRYLHAPPDVHPRSIFGGTRSIIALGCRMVRGALKTIEEGNYWQAYNCDSYQYLNEVLAPHMLRKIVMFLEDLGYTSVPIHNPFGARQGRPVRPGGTQPDGQMSLRVVGCAAGLGELGLSKLLLTPQFGPRQRVFAVLTDAVLEPDPLIAPGTVCDRCGSCIKACPAAAMARQDPLEVRIGPYTYTHGPFDPALCTQIHQGWDPRYSPFLRPDSSKDNPPPYYKFLDTRFRHHSICGARGCVRMCMDHLERTGRISMQYRTPMVEGNQWIIEEPLG
jgi:epoxyqueuosine reductase